MSEKNSLKFFSIKEFLWIRRVLRFITSSIFGGRYCGLLGMFSILFSYIVCPQAFLKFLTAFSSPAYIVA